MALSLHMVLQLLHLVVQGPTHEAGECDVGVPGGILQVSRDLPDLVLGPFGAPLGVLFETVLTGGDDGRAEGTLHMDIH